MLWLSLLPTTAHHSPSVGDCPSPPPRLFVLYVLDSPHSCPTLLPAPARPSPRSPSRPDPKRSPERPSQKAPFVLSRAATPAGFDGRFVLEALIISQRKPNPDPVSASLFLPIAPIPVDPAIVPHRQQKCDEQPNEEGACQTCVRLRLQCLGFGAKRPDWMRVSVYRSARLGANTYSRVSRRTTASLSFVTRSRRSSLPRA